ncbi:hypothetical protein SDC9_209268 [bioreactor metagenome]|uniref:Uncharacterized protein n=1 Tax=bioreactor metagenome TaxID=1076179 RepID=A0A645JEK4_9ZZZZ
MPLHTGNVCTGQRLGHIKNLHMIPHKPRHGVDQTGVLRQRGEKPPCQRRAFPVVIVGRNPASAHGRSLRLSDIVEQRRPHKRSGIRAAAFPVGGFLHHQQGMFPDVALGMVHRRLRGILLPQ